MKHLSLLDEFFKFSHKHEERSVEDIDYRSALREHIIRDNLMPSDRQCSIQMHALVSQGAVKQESVEAGGGHRQVFSPVHLQSLCSYHSLVALQYLET